MKLNFRHLFVIMPVSVEFIFMHMQNTYEDYMTKIQQLSILYQTNHSEFFFCTFALIIAFFLWHVHVSNAFFHVHQFTFGCHSNSIFNWIVWANSILQRPVLFCIKFSKRRKNGFSRFGNSHHVIIWRRVRYFELNSNWYIQLTKAFINSSSNNYIFWTDKCRA